MSSLGEVLKKPFFEFKGSGKIVFNAGLSVDINFIIKMLQNGKIIGNLDFLTYHSKIDSYVSQMKNFTLIGKLQENNVNIIAEKCYLTSLSSSMNIDNSKITVNGKFDSGEVLFFPEVQDKKTK